MTSYGSRDPQRFLDGWLDRLLWQVGIVRRAQYVKLTAAYDDVFGWWSKQMREDMDRQESDAQNEDERFEIARITIVKSLGDDDRVAVFTTWSEDLALIEALGMLRFSEDTVIRTFMGEDGDDERG